MTCDGTSSNFDTFRLLGCKFAPDYNNIKVSFPHPTRDHQVYAILDTCHMVKFARNTLGDLGSFKDNEQGIIDLSFFRRLAKLQDEESVSLGNSININYIVWQRHKMKVNLEVQTLSSSVANALEFLKDELKLPEFKRCAATVQFIRKIDRIFDVLNSRDPYGKGFKYSLRHSNISLTESIFKETGEYLLSLLTNENQFLVKAEERHLSLDLSSACDPLLPCQRSYCRKTFQICFNIQIFSRPH